MSNNCGVHGGRLRLLLENRRISRGHRVLHRREQGARPGSTSPASCTSNSPRKAPPPNGSGRRGWDWRRLHAYGSRHIGGRGWPAPAIQPGLRAGGVAAEGRPNLPRARDAAGRGDRLDVTLVRAAVADGAGSLVFHGSARNFNPASAMAGRLTIAEAERVVIGDIDPDDVHLPGVFVSASCRSPPDQACRKDIKKRTTRVMT